MIDGLSSSTTSTSSPSVGSPNPAQTPLVPSGGSSSIPGDSVTLAEGPDQDSLPDLYLGGDRPSLSPPSTELDSEKRTLADKFESGDWAEIAEMDIGFLALLMGHKSKEEVISALKNVLQTRQKGIDEKSKYIQEKQAEILAKQAEAQKEQSLWNKITSALTIVGALVGAIVTTIAGVATTVASGGVAGALAIAGIALAWGACACTIADEAVKNDPNMSPEDKEKHMKALGIAGMALGIASAVAMAGSGISAGVQTAARETAKKTLEEGAKAATKEAAKEATKEITKEATKEVAKKTVIEGAKAGVKEATQKTAAGTLKSIAAVTGFLGGILEGATSVAIGAGDIEIAKEQRELDEMKIELEKDRLGLQNLEKYLNQISQFSEEILKLMLQSEETVADEVERSASVQEQLVNNIPSTA